MAGSENGIAFEDFTKVDIRVAKILEAEDHPNADKLLVMKADFGTEQRQLVAGIKGHYKPEDIVGKSIVVVTNLKPRAVRGVDSQGMLLAAVTEGETQIALIIVDGDVPPGTKVT